jgi:hypothetical protein
MMKGYTPGPWETNEIKMHPTGNPDVDRPCAVYTKSRPQKFICTTLDADVRPLIDEQSAADCRLLAAAPELFQCLQDLVNAADENDAVFFRIQARKILAKAKGDSP